MTQSQQLCRTILDILSQGVDVTTTTKPWGLEHSFMIGDALCKIIVVEEGERTSVQSHVEKEEVTIRLSGSGGVQRFHRWGDGTLQEFGFPQGTTWVQPGEVHRTVGPCVLFEVQTNHPDDVVRYADDYGRAKEDE